MINSAYVDNSSSPVSRKAKKTKKSNNYDSANKNDAQNIEDNILAVESRYLHHESTNDLQSTINNRNDSSTLGS